jgi:hypothetical protein
MLSLLLRRRMDACVAAHSSLCRHIRPQRKTFCNTVLVPATVLVGGMQYRVAASELHSGQSATSTASQSCQRSALMLSALLCTSNYGYCIGSAVLAFQL